jgi:hypothetical protein
MKNEEKDLRKVLEKIQEKLKLNEEYIPKMMGYKDLNEYQNSSPWSEYEFKRSVTLTGIVTGLLGFFGNDFDTVRKWLTTEREFKKYGENLGSLKPLELMVNYPKGLDLVDVYVLDIRGLG